MPSTAIILCGGLAKRMRPITEEIPKCLVQLNGRALLDYQMKYLRAGGIKKIILACGYKWEKIKEIYGDQFIYSVESEPLGTGGAVKLALKYVDEEEFFVLDCDEIMDLDFQAFGKIGAPALVASRFHCQFGVVDMDEKGNVIKFVQYPLLENVWANAGIYLFSKKTPLPDKGAFETTTFNEVKLKAYKHPGFWLTLNTVKDIDNAEKFVKEKNILP